MRAFIPADIPDTCYLTEVLLWVALGRVPVARYDLYGHEIRSVPCYEERDYETDGLDYFYEQEFDAIDATIDYSKYFEATQSWGYCSSFDVNHNPDEVRIRYFGESREISEKELNTVKYFDEFNRLFDPLIEKAKIKIFSSLLDERLVGWGYIGERGCGPDSKEINNEYTGKGEIESKIWTIDACDWFEDSLVVGDKEYFMIQFNTHDVFKLFPEPLIPPKPAHGHAYGTSILVHDTETRIVAPSRPKRGRPAKQGGLIRKAVQNVFSDRIRKGKAPEKAEALYQEVIEFVEVAFKEKISRTTAQGYIRPIQDQMPENLPEKKQ